VFIVAGLVVLASAALWGAKRLFWPASEAAQHPTDEVSASSPTQEEKLERAIQAKPEGIRQALREYAKTSEDVALILSEDLEAKNIGGAVAVAVTNWQFNHDKGVYRQPEELGLLRIKDEKALVNRAIKGDAIIESVTVTPQPGRAFKVVITVFNKTAFPLECKAPKGQVIELKDGRLLSPTPTAGRSEYPQGVASANRKGDKSETIIPPKDRDTLEFIAYCVNEDLARPDGVTLANVTLFQIANIDFETPNKLHQIMRQLNHA
jgi:hypothetical protein